MAVVVICREAGLSGAEDLVGDTNPLQPIKQATARGRIMIQRALRSSGKGLALALAVTSQGRPVPVEVEDSSVGKHLANLSLFRLNLFGFIMVSTLSSRGVGRSLKIRSGTTMTGDLQIRVYAGRWRKPLVGGPEKVQENRAETGQVGAVR